MPTFAWLARFRADFDRLTPEQQEAFLVAIGHFVEDLRSGGGCRHGLTIKGIRGAPGIFELAWAGDGRATFEYGTAVVDGEPHVIWRRAGTHTIFDRP